MSYVFRRPFDYTATQLLRVALRGSSATVTGTALANIDEADVVAGGKTIIITLVGVETWKAAGTAPVGDEVDSQAIIDGLDSNKGDTFGWNNEVRDKEVTSAITRDSATQITILLTAQAAYDLTSGPDETITVTVPAAAVNGSAAITATPTFTVAIDSAAFTPRLALLGVG